MKVLMTADTVGGVWTYVVELSRALVEEGAAIALATMGAPPSLAQRAEVASIPRVELFESCFKLEWMESAWDDVQRAGDWLLEVAGRVSPDVVHLNGYAHGALPWNAPRIVVGHSCVLSWWRAVNGQDAPSGWSHYRRIVRSGLQAADVVVAPTLAMLDELDRHYGPLDRTVVIANGRTARRFLPARKEPLILSAGRLWDDAKNVTALDRIAARLPWSVYVAGSLDHPDGGAARVNGGHLLGLLDEPALAGWMGRAAIFALPARYEPFGLSALEAGLAGCALVLGDIPSQHEVWGDAATYVPPDEPDRLERAIRTLIDQPERRSEMAARARARARTYSTERMAAGYLATYRSLRREQTRSRPVDQRSTSHVVHAGVCFTPPSLLSPSNLTKDIVIRGGSD